MRGDNWENKMIRYPLPSQYLNSKFRPDLFAGKQADQHLNEKPFCDVLGWTICQKCSEEWHREKSFTSSMLEATSYLHDLKSSGVFSFDRSGLAFSRSQSRSCSECGEEQRIDRIVKSIFPIIYTSMSDVIDNPSKQASETDSDVRSESRNTKSISSLPGRSQSSCNSVEDLEIEHLFGQLHETNTVQLSEGEQKLPAFRNRTILENSSLKSRKLDISDKSLQKLVRRSSSAGVHVRKSADNMLKAEIEKWQPSFVGEYARARRKSTVSNPIQSVITESERKKKSRLPDLSAQKSGAAFHAHRILPLLPMEPVKCRIKYIRNRWKDEALFNENDFAIRLDDA